MSRKTIAAALAAAMLCSAAATCSAAAIHHASPALGEQRSYWLASENAPLDRMFLPSGDISVGGSSRMTAGGTISISGYEWTPLPLPSTILLGLEGRTELPRPIGGSITLVSLQEVPLPSSLSLVLATAAASAAGLYLRGKPAGNRDAEPA